MVLAFAVFWVALSPDWEPLLSEEDPAIGKCERMQGQECSNR